jgi:hypothetical protein
VASPQPNSSFGDWWNSVLDPGGNLEALRREAQRNDQLRQALRPVADRLREHLALLGADPGAAAGGGGWRGATHDAYVAKLTPLLKVFEDHTQAYGLAHDAHVDQAQQKENQQRQAEMAKLALIFLAGMVGITLLASPVGAAVLGGVAETIEGVAAGMTGATVATEETAATGLARLLQFGMRFLAMAEADAAAVLRTVASADRLLAQLLETVSGGLGKLGLTTVDGLKSMGLIGLVTVPARMVEKALAGENPLNWTATDVANTAFIVGLGPAVSLKLIAGPVGALLKDASIPEPLAAALTLGASKSSGLTAAGLLGSAAEGAFWNGSATGIGAFIINGKPVDDGGSWGQVALSGVAGYEAGIGGAALINRFPRLVGKKILGTPTDVAARTLLAFPADVAIAWGTADQTGTQHVAPPGAAPARPEAAAAFDPALVGGEKVTVQPGESLYSIAKRDLGDGNLWPALQQANPGPVDGHPDVIQPGDVIDEPLLPKPRSAPRPG